MGIESFGEKLSKFARDARDGAQKAGNSVSLNSRISAEKRELEKIYAQIGEAVYKANPDVSVPELKEKYDAVKESLKKIGRLEEELNKLTGAVVCPQCGKKVAVGAKFCPHCGAKLPEMAGEETKTAENPETDDNRAEDTENAAESVNQEEKSADTGNTDENVEKGTGDTEQETARKDEEGTDRKEDSVSGTTADAAEKLKKDAKDAASQTGDIINDAADAARGFMSDVADKAGSFMKGLSSRLSEGRKNTDQNAAGQNTADAGDAEKTAQESADSSAAEGEPAEERDKSGSGEAQTPGAENSQEAETEQKKGD